MRSNNKDYDLEDLIVPEPKKSSYKNILTILSLLIILIFVAISFVNTLIDNKDKTENNITSTTNKQTPTKEKKDTPKQEKEITKTDIKPKIKTDKVKNDTDNSLDNLFDDDKTKDNMPSPIDETKDIVNIDDSYDANYTTPVIKEDIKSIKQPMKDVTKEVTKEIKPDIVKEVIEKPKEVIKPKKVVIQKPKHIKKIQKIDKPKHIKKPHKTVEKHINKTDNYYIQVGSFRNYPSKRFLSVIKNSGFNYIVTKPNANGIRRLLIGGYPSRSVANGALKRVKDRINKNSYIIKR